MAKKVKAYIKLQIDGGKANPAPPVGPALGQHGIPIQEFCMKFNEATRDQMGVKIPVVITVYDDRSFDFILKQPPASFLIKQKINLQKGSSKPNKDKVGKLSQKDLREIAERKMPDLNANTIEAAMEIIAGTARSMGVEVEK